MHSTTEISLQPHPDELTEDCGGQGSRHIKLTPTARLSCDAGRYHLALTLVAAAKVLSLSDHQWCALLRTGLRPFDTNLLFFGTALRAQIPKFRSPDDTVLKNGGVISKRGHRVRRVFQPQIFNGGLAVVIWVA